jgi:natural product biosynthesis luciferase-like monooxygenase protein
MKQTTDHRPPPRRGPLSYGQRALWFLQQLAPDSGAYNVKLAARISAGVDAKALRNAFQLLVNRHPSLRTVFPTFKGKPVQQVQECQVVNFTEADASALNPEQLRRRLSEESHKPFDLERGPLLCIHLFKSSPHEHVLLLTMHHIVVDFWSVALILSELSTLYAAGQRCADEILLPLEFQYLDYANWQIEMLAGSEGERLWTYWRQQLTGKLTPLNLPTDRPRRQVQTFRGAARAFKLGARLTTQLKVLAISEAADMFTLLLAAFQSLLYLYTAQADILVGSPPVGQRRAGFERVVGFFHNPVVLRANLSGNLTFKELLNQVRRTVEDALCHQEYPFSLLVERLQPTRDPASSPIFQVMFVFYKDEGQRVLPFLTGEAGSRVNLGGLELELLDIEEQVSMLDLTLTMIEEGESLSASLQYNTDLFDGATIERMTEDFRCLLEALARNPQAQVIDLCLAVEPDQLQPRRQIVSGLDKQAETTQPTRASSQIAPRRMDFSLFYFASAEQAAAEDSYRLLIEGAKFADRHGFTAIWTPERHFHSFGGLFPNPSITSAAIAAITERVQIRAGSVVLPLHHPVRVAEEWAVVDNLSKGRVGISFASGWNTDDFVFAPEDHARRKEMTMRGVETVRRLWRGETVAFAGVDGQELQVKTLPRPIQRELPVWLTAAGPAETFRLAGEIGAHVLTHLLGQSIEMLSEKIALYRRSWREHGHGSETGRVTLMLHTFIGENGEAVREKVRRPLSNYLKHSLDQVLGLMQGAGDKVDPKDLTEENLDALVSYAFNRLYETSGLCGTPASCLGMIDRLRNAGVDEVACLIDFGVDFDSVMASLRCLEQVMLASNRASNPGGEVLAGAAATLPAQSFNDRADEILPLEDIRADISFQEVFDRATTRRILMSRQRQAKENEI